MKNKLIFNLLIPLVVPLVFFMVAATPVEILGCRTRGLIAVGIALAGALAGLACAVKGLIDKIKGEHGSGWWMVKHPHPGHASFSYRPVRDLNPDAQILLFSASSR